MTKLILSIIGTIILHTSIWTTASADDTADRIVFVPHGYISVPQIWPRFNIDYCWMNQYDETSKGLVISVIREKIERAYLYKFHDVGLCETEQLPRIKIRFVDSQSWSLIGWLDSYKDIPAGDPTMELNVTFASWDPRDAYPPSKRCKDPEYKVACVRAIALHEFMHSIGFLHELLRPEALSKSAQCLASKPSYRLERDNEIKQFINYLPKGSMVPVAEYDDNSWMNYCNNIYDKEAELSIDDGYTLKVIEQVTERKIKTGR
jgi:hypothetical protein